MARLYLDLVVHGITRIGSSAEGGAGLAERGLRLKIIFVILAAAAIGYFAPARAYKLTVIPNRLELTVKPGGRVQGKIMVGGEFDQPTRVRASIADWGMDAQGKVILQRLGTQPRSMAKWLWLSPAEFLLSRGRTQIVNYQIKAPAGISGSYWCALFFESAPAGPVARDTVGLRTAVRLATMIYVSTKRLGRLNVEIEDVTAAYGAGRLVWRARFSNPGEFFVRPSGFFLLKNARTGKLAARVPLPGPALLPGATLVCEAEWRGKLAAGQYVPSVQIDFNKRGARQGPPLKVG